jgi:hypothetical protein
VTRTSIRFWSHVDKNGGPERLRWETIKDAEGDGTVCWVWLRGKNIDGYGYFRFERQVVMAHRYAWELVNGPIPPEICVCHYCDHPACVNPDHLYLGEARDYAAYTSQKGHCLAQLYPERLPRGDNHPNRLHPERLARGDNHPSRLHPERLPRGDRHGARLHPERLRPAFGEQHGQSKLTEEEVREILRLRQTGMEYQELARKFNISTGTTSRICNGTIWKHIIRTPSNMGSKEEFKIEKGIPIIKRRRGASNGVSSELKIIPIPLRLREKMPLNEMELGDSFFVAIPEGKTQSQFRDQVRWIVNGVYNKKNGSKHFTVRNVDDGVRVWRVEDRDVA